MNVFIPHFTNVEVSLDFIFARGAYRDRKVEYIPRVILLAQKLSKVDWSEVHKDV